MKKILIIVLVLCLCPFSVISVSAQVDNKPDNTKKYLDEVYMLLNNEPINVSYRDYYFQNYDVLFEYSSIDNATPDYACVFAGFDGEPAYSYGVFGDYVVTSYSCCNPYLLGYYVYIPTANEIYTLREASIMEFPGIEKAFTDCGIAELIGDVNGDDKLTIQDATEIQKFVAQLIESYKISDQVLGIREADSIELRYISDFNRDGSCNIKDATAIQKSLAKLEY